MKTLIIVVILLVAVGVGWFFTKVPSSPASENLEQEVGHDREFDLVRAVSESIVGAWQSDQDLKYVREFRTDGVVVDSYEGSAPAGGAWSVFTSSNAPAVSFPLEENTAYVQLVFGDEYDPYEALFFKVGALTPEKLELIYLGRGGVLSFTRIEQ